jgi:ATP-binding cassette subfamily B protein
MEAGRIVQRGTHEELMRLPGPYLRVAELQLVDRRDIREIARESGETGGTSA